MNREEFIYTIGHLKLIKFVKNGDHRYIYHIVDGVVEVMDIDMNDWDYDIYNPNGKNKRTNGFPLKLVNSLVQQTLEELSSGSCTPECIPFLIKRLHIGKGTLITDITKEIECQLDNAFLDMECSNLSKEHIAHMDVQCSRENGNTNKDTFDFVKCQMYLYRVIDKTPKEVYEWFCDNKKLVLKVMRNYVKNSQNFKKYGVPISWLRCTRVTVDTTKVIHFTYELKNIASE